MIKYFFVHRKDQFWCCAASHNTDILPGKETHLADEKGQIKPMDYRTDKPYQ